jgi:CheY-like chemotaxis protein
VGLTGHLQMIVLIVDDNTAVRRVIRGVLADVEAEIHECASAEEALALFKTHTPDWVLMDLELHGLDGIAATRIIRTVWPEARVCIVTNYDDARLRLEAGRAGACAFVGKQDLLALPDILASRANT